MALHLTKTDKDKGKDKDKDKDNHLVLFRLLATLNTCGDELMAVCPSLFRVGKIFCTFFSIWAKNTLHTYTEWKKTAIHLILFRPLSCFSIGPPRAWKS